MSNKLLSLFFSVCVACAMGCGNDGDKDAGPRDSVMPLDLPPNLAHGQVCDNPGGVCKDKINGMPLYCIALAAGGAPGRGFCSLQCTPPIGRECYGVANSTWADCLVQGAAPDGGTAPSYCAFVCAKGGKSYTCPPTLECADKTSGDTRFCVPRPK